MIRLFSSRRESITAGIRRHAARFEQQYGRAPSQRELAQASNFATRAAKTGTLDLAQAHAGWADTLETAWAPPWVGDKLRQVRAAAREARLAGLRASAEAAAARQRGARDSAARKQELTASYHALDEAYRQRETVFAVTMADRADWDAATRAQRQLAVAADAELSRRHPDQHYSPLRSAGPDPAAETQDAELALTPSKPPSEMGKWITDLASAHRTFADRLADRQSVKIPAEDPTFGDLGQAFATWPGEGKDAILQPPKPEIRPSPHVLERATDRHADWEAAD